MGPRGFLKQPSGRVHMKTLLISSLVFLVCACGKEEETDREVDITLQPVLDMYLAAAPDDDKADSLVSLRFSNDVKSNWVRCEFNTSKKIGRKTKYEVSVIVKNRVFTPALRAYTMRMLASCVHNVQYVDDTQALMAKNFMLNGAYWEVEGRLEQKTKEAFQ